MDLISHALINNLLFKELPLEQRWWVIAAGVLPDLLSTCGVWKLEFFKKLLFFKKIPSSFFPPYVFVVYNIMHSAVIWTVIFVSLWLLGYRTVAVIWSGWGVHIGLDFFTHNAKSSLPTKIFWPLSHWHYHGFSWSSAKFLLVEYIILAALYLIFF